MFHKNINKPNRLNSIFNIYPTTLVLLLTQLLTKCLSAG